MGGDQAYHSYYTIRAIQAYTEALDLLPDTDAAPLTIAKMHEKLGDAFAQRANADEAWREYSQALQLMKEDPEVDREALLCLYIRLADLSTRWSGGFKTPPAIQEWRFYLHDGPKLLHDQSPCADIAP